MQEVFLMEKRIEWVDVLKGIGIIIVVLGHSGVPYELKKFLLSFSMPLFFFISGYLFKNESNNIGSFFKKRVRSLLIPYFWFSIITYMLWVMVERNIKDSTTPTLKPLIGIFYSNNINDFMVYNGVLWFLTCLFIVEMIYSIINNKIKNRKHIMLIIVSFSILGYLDSLYFSIRLPWGIDVALTGVVFYGIGNLLQIYINNFFYSYHRKIGLLITSIIIILLTAIIERNNTIVYMYDNTYGNYILFYLAGFMGIAASFAMALFISKSKILSFYGKNSIIVLAVHIKIFSVFNIILKILGHNKSGTIFELVKGFAYSLVSLLICIPIIFILNNYMPFILGRSINKKIGPNIESKNINLN
jgi:acyltransferase